MKYALIHRLKSTHQHLVDFSKRYDPQYELIGHHITLVFPFEISSKNEAELVKSIEAVLREWKKFSVLFSIYELSWDKWLFLTPSEGGDEIVSIHDELYKIPLLKDYLRPDIPFIPHISLGLFAKNEDSIDISQPQDILLDSDKYDNAMAELKREKVEISFDFNEVELISVSDDYSDVNTIRVFELES